MLKKLILTFIAGVFLGSGMTWLVISQNSTEPESPDNTPAMELKIAPLFAENIERLQIYRTSKSKIMSVCCNCGSAFNTMWNSTMPREYIPHCSTKLRMKFISALAIQQIQVTLVQDSLHRSFRKSCPAQGDRRIPVFGKINNKFEKNLFATILSDCH